MRRPGPIDDDGPGGAKGEPQAPGGEFALQGRAIRRRLPGSECLGPDIVELHAGAGFLQALLRRRRRDRLLGFDDARPIHPFDDVGPAFLKQPVRDAAGVRRRGGLQAEGVGDPDRDVGAPGVIVAGVDHAAVVADQAVDAVLVTPTVFHVLGADVSAGQPELGLERPPPRVEDSLRIRRVGRRVAMDVVAGPIGPAAGCAGDELGKLRVEIAARDDAAGLDDQGFLGGLGLQEVGAESAAALASGAAGDHR